MVRKPDWDVTCMIRADNSGSKGRVGAAWNNEDGSIGIVLNPFIVLAQMDNISIRLFPARQSAEENKDEFAPKPVAELAKKPKRGGTFE